MAAGRSRPPALGTTRSGCHTASCLSPCQPCAALAPLPREEPALQGPQPAGRPALPTAAATPAGPGREGLSQGHDPAQGRLSAWAGTSRVTRCPPGPACGQWSHRGGRCPGTPRSARPALSAPSQREARGHSGLLLAPSIKGNSDGSPGRGSEAADCHLPFVSQILTSVLSPGPQLWAAIPGAGHSSVTRGPGGCGMSTRA